MSDKLLEKYIKPKFRREETLPEGWNIVKTDKTFMLHSHPSRSVVRFSAAVVNNINVKIFAYRYVCNFEDQKLVRLSGPTAPINRNVDFLASDIKKQVLKAVL